MRFPLGSKLLISFQLLLAHIKGLLLFLIPKFSSHTIMIPLTKMHNKINEIMIWLYDIQGNLNSVNLFVTLDITKKSWFRCYFLHPLNTMKLWFWFCCVVFFKITMKSWLCCDFLNQKKVMKSWFHIYFFQKKIHTKLRFHRRYVYNRITIPLNVNLRRK